MGVILNKERKDTDIRSLQNDFTVSCGPEWEFAQKYSPGWLNQYRSCWDILNLEQSEQGAS